MSRVPLKMIGANLIKTNGTKISLMTNNEITFRFTEKEYSGKIESFYNNGLGIYYIQVLNVKKPDGTILPNKVRLYTEEVTEVVEHSNSKLNENVTSIQINFDLIENKTFPRFEQLRGSFVPGLFISKAAIGSLVFNCTDQIQFRFNENIYSGKIESFYTDRFDNRSIQVENLKKPDGGIVPKVRLYPDGTDENTIESQGSVPIKIDFASIQIIPNAVSQKPSARAAVPTSASAGAGAAAPQPLETEVNERFVGLREEMFPVGPGNKNGFVHQAIPLVEKKRYILDFAVSNETLEIPQSILDYLAVRVDFLDGVEMKYNIPGTSQKRFYNIYLIHPFGTEITHTFWIYVSRDGYVYSIDPSNYSFTPINLEEASLYQYDLKTQCTHPWNATIQFEFGTAWNKNDFGIPVKFYYYMKDIRNRNGSIYVLDRTFMPVEKVPGFYFFKYKKNKKEYLLSINAKCVIYRFIEGEGKQIFNPIEELSNKEKIQFNNQNDDEAMIQKLVVAIQSGKSFEEFELENKRTFTENTQSKKKIRDLYQIALKRFDRPYPKNTIQFNNKNDDEALIQKLVVAIQSGKNINDFELQNMRTSASKSKKTARNLYQIAMETVHGPSNEIQGPSSSPYTAYSPFHGYLPPQKPFARQVTPREIPHIMVHTNPDEQIQNTVGNIPKVLNDYMQSIGYSIVSKPTHPGGIDVKCGKNTEKINTYYKYINNGSKKIFGFLLKKDDNKINEYYIMHLFQNKSGYFCNPIVRITYIPQNNAASMASSEVANRGRNVLTMTPALSASSNSAVATSVPVSAPLSHPLPVAAPLPATAAAASSNSAGAGGVPADVPSGAKGSSSNISDVQYLNPVSNAEGAYKGLSFKAKGNRILLEGNYIFSIRYMSISQNTEATMPGVSFRAVFPMVVNGINTFYILCSHNLDRTFFLLVDQNIFKNNEMLSLTKFSPIPNEIMKLTHGIVYNTRRVDFSTIKVVSSFLQPFEGKPTNEDELVRLLVFDTSGKKKMPSFKMQFLAMIDQEKFPIPADQPSYKDLKDRVNTRVEQEKRELSRLRQLSGGSKKKSRRSSSTTKKSTKKTTKSSKQKTTKKTTKSSTKKSTRSKRTKK